MTIDGFYRRAASRHRQNLIQNQNVGLEMRERMEAARHGCGDYWNARKHLASLAFWRGVSLCNWLAEEGILRDAALLAAKAMVIDLEVDALHRMGSRASREVVRWSNEAARFRRDGLEFFASRGVPGIPAHAKEQLARMALLRDDALLVRNCAEWLKGKPITARIKK